MVGLREQDSLLRIGPKLRESYIAHLSQET